MAAWRSLYARCLPLVWRQALAMVRDHNVAEEIVSESLLALVRGISRLDADSVHLHSWLRGVVRHKVADYGRQKNRQNRLLSAAQETQSNDGDSVTPSSSLEAEEKRNSVLKVLDRLPETQRLMLEWKHVDDLSVREIAARLGQTEKSVESVLYRARKEFRRLFELTSSDEIANSGHAGNGKGALEKSL